MVMEDAVGNTSLARSLPVTSLESDLDSTRQPCFSTRQPCFSTRQPCFSTRQPCFSTRQPCFRESGNLLK
ncbi:hypothetical protein J6590_023097 [Homalodisca vitripennis]|nr:hypothetical protein J6590_023097 [Homalodisca vitripennis]